jgi:Fe-S-cluster containining protein
MMSENLCHSCTGACCKGPITMSLNKEEYQMMVETGTELKTIAEPVDHDRDDVVYPAGWSIDPKKGTMRMMVERGRETEPLAAGLGRYTMWGTCGNLKEILGVEQCAIYGDRPQVCRDFEMGGPKCLLIRQIAGAE